MGNHSLHSIAKFSHHLTHLTIGGEITQYNLNFTKEGFESLTHSVMPLQEFNVLYVAKVGDDVVKLIATKFCKTLQSTPYNIFTFPGIEITRNCFERCSKISDKGLSYLKQCEKLTHLSLTYSRKFRETVNLQLSNLHQLQYLCLKHCPVL